MNNLILFYDTETNNLPLFDQPSDDPRQPHIVQIAACLVDADTRKVVQSLDLIIQPDRWEIPEEVAKIHGITTEYASEVGVGECMALGIFLELWETADLRVGHNESFDARILRIAIKRHDSSPDETADRWKAGKAECTARLATPHCKLPPTKKMIAAGRRHHKTANLQEAYTHFIGKPFEDAHSALADVQACAAVYWSVKDLNGANTNRATDDEIVI